MEVFKFKYVWTRTQADIRGDFTCRDGAVVIGRTIKDRNAPGEVWRWYLFGSEDPSKGFAVEGHEDTPRKAAAAVEAAYESLLATGPRARRLKAASF